MVGKNEIYVERFMKIYVNLPLPERDSVVIVIDDEPISWSVAYKEIKEKTELGKKIGKKLIELKII